MKVLRNGFAIFCVTLLMFNCGIETEFIDEILTIPPKFTIHSDSAEIKDGMTSLKTGSKIKLKIIYRDSLNNLDSTVNINFISTDVSVISVDSSGLVQAGQTGEANIIITAYPISNPAQILLKDTVMVMVDLDVNQNKLSLVRTGPGNLRIGDTIYFQSIVTNLLGDTLPITSQWNLSDSTLATISNLGTFIANDSGKVAVNFTTDNSSSVWDTISIKSEALSYIIISPVSQVIEGQKVTISARYFDTSGVLIPQKFSWKINDSTLASIDTSGILTAIKPGLVEVIVTAPDNTVEKSFVTIILDPLKVSRVLVSSSQSEINLGDSVLFNANPLNVLGDTISGKTVIWSSSNSQVLDMDTNGIGAAKSEGSADITATIDGVVSMPLIILVGKNSTSGSFAPRPGSGYEVRGTGTLRKNSQGNFEVYLGTDFFASNGPGLVVYLSKTNTVTTESIELGPLQLNSGEQTYSVNNSIAINDYPWIIIHCKPFDVTFGYAQLN